MAGLGGAQILLIWAVPRTLACPHVPELTMPGPHGRALCGNRTHDTSLTMAVLYRLS